MALYVCKTCGNVADHILYERDGELVPFRSAYSKLFSLAHMLCWPCVKILMGYPVGMLGLMNYKKSWVGHGEIPSKIIEQELEPEQV